MCRPAQFGPFTGFTARCPAHVFGVRSRTSRAAFRSGPPGQSAISGARGRSEERRRACSTTRRAAARAFADRRSDFGMPSRCAARARARSCRASAAARIRIAAPGSLAGAEADAPKEGAVIMEKPSRPAGAVSRCDPRFWHAFQCSATIRAPRFLLIRHRDSAPVKKVSIRALRFGSSRDVRPRSVVCADSGGAWRARGWQKGA